MLSDERGPIPTFPPLAVDDLGRIIPMSKEEVDARTDAALRVLALASSRESVMPDLEPETVADLVETGIANDPDIEAARPGNWLSYSPYRREIVVHPRKLAPVPWHWEDETFNYRCASGIAFFDATCDTTVLMRRHRPMREGQAYRLFLGQCPHCMTIYWFLRPD